MLIVHDKDAALTVSFLSFCLMRICVPTKLFFDISVELKGAIEVNCSDSECWSQATQDYCKTHAC